MTLNERWRTLADLFTELQKKDEKILPTILTDLRSAKTMIEILKVDPAHVENIPKIESLLGNVEAHLILVAEERSGLDYAESWIRKLEDARKAIVVEKANKTQKFVTGVPKNEQWVRIQLSEQTPSKEVERLAKEQNLSYKVEDEYMLVYGDDASLKVLIRKLRQHQHSLKKNESYNHEHDRADIHF